MTRRWSLRLVAALFVGASLLAGCADKQQASDSLPSATAAPTEETLPPLGPEDLPMPAEARTPDAAGAEAFVRYYIELINRTSETLDPLPIRTFSDGCAECDRIADDAERDAEAGYHYEGGELSLLEIGKPLTRQGTAQIPFRVALAQLTVVDEAGDPVPGLAFESFPDLLSSAALEWNEDMESWTLTQLDLG